MFDSDFTQISAEIHLYFGQILSKNSNFVSAISSEILPKYLKWPKFVHLGQGRNKTQNENQNTGNNLLVVSNLLYVL